MCGSLGHADVLVSDAWVDGLELFQESSDGKAVGRRGSIEQEGLLALRHGWCYVVGLVGVHGFYMPAKWLAQHPSEMAQSGFGVLALVRLRLK